MAYIDLQHKFVEAAGITALDPATIHAGRATRLSPAASLSPLEWLVVAVAERDSLASLRAPGRVATLFGALFGAARSPGFANPRLEALRRIAVMHWRRGNAVDPGEVSGFLAAGYSSAQHELVAASIRTARATKSDRRAAR